MKPSPVARELLGCHPTGADWTDAVVASVLFGMFAFLSGFWLGEWNTERRASEAAARGRPAAIAKVPADVILGCTTASFEEYARICRGRARLSKVVKE